ncbi:sensor histidine kinase [Amycolatopsis vastitatis]|uniref:histidine kinase n=1 Tax=Amycolatopsis vastitatis TaxID=1905142 RepID=A0A229SV78_9PSEU|nr:HAMP domain-containing sensor histidine kinase [Amycolatopsis vastitatis]OXM62660.1 two-component sensor histidine kinase [Amycolatopsis vastitatis]
MAVRRLGTVRVRLTVLAVLVVGLGLLAGGAVVVTLVRQNLTVNAENLARQRAHDTAAEVAAAGTGRVPLGAALVQVVDRSGRVVAAGTALAGRGPLLPGWPDGSGPAIVENPGIEEDHDYTVAGVTVTAGSGSLAVYAASSLDPAAEAVDATTSALAVSSPVLLAGIAALAWLLVGRALRPVEAIRHEVAGIGAGELARRVPEPATADEVGLLARTMNAMLGRLQFSAERQSRFVADAAHELRSPVAGMLARLEVGLAHPDRTDWPRLARDTHQEAARLAAVTDELLTLSKLDSSSGATGPVDLDELVLAETESLSARGKVRVGLSPFTPARLPGRAGELRRLIRNLLDNAERHATSRVTVGLSTEDGHAELVVTDDGAGIPPADRERVFARFSRLDAARTRDDGGTGLGLAIVREVATGHGGSAWVADSPGGAEVHVRLPRET